MSETSQPAGSNYAPKSLALSSLLTLLLVIYFDLPLARMLWLSLTRDAGSDAIIFAALFAVVGFLPLNVVGVVAMVLLRRGRQSGRLFALIYGVVATSLAALFWALTMKPGVAWRGELAYIGGMLVIGSAQVVSLLVRRDARGDQGSTEAVSRSNAPT